MAKQDIAGQAPQAEVRRAPAEWARIKGQWVEFSGIANAALDQGSHFKWQHAAAASVHGWDLHEHHEGGPIQLTEQEYQAALDAACPAKGLPKQHEPARSKHAPKLERKPVKE